MGTIVEIIVPHHSSVGMHVVTLCVTGPEGAGNGIFFIFIYGITK